MTTWRLAWARARARTGVLVAVAATAVVVVVALSVVVGSVTAAMRAVVVTAVAAAPADAREAQLRVPADSDDPDAQRQGVAALLSGAFGGSLIVHQEAAEAADAGGSARWTLTVDPDRLDPWAVPALADRLRYLDRDVRTADDGRLAPQGASVSGGLAGTLAEASATVGAVVAVMPVPLALIALAGLIALLQLAGLLGASRAAEARLLRARGLSDGDSRRLSLIESTLTIGVGAVAGWAVGALAAAASTAGLSMSFLPAVSSALGVTVVVPVACTLIAGPLAGRRAHRAAVSDGAGDGGRMAATWLVAIVLVAAAGVGVWQLRGAATATTAPANTPDLWRAVVTAVSPALVLAAIGFVVLASFPVGARLVAAISARRVGPLPVLPARDVARAPHAFGVVVALVALAAAGAVTAAVSSASWTDAARSSALLVAGGDARTESGARVVPAQVAQVAATDGVDAAMAVVSAPGHAGDTALTLQAVPSTAALSAGIDRDAVAAVLGTPAPGLVLSEDAAELVAVVEVHATGTNSFLGWNMTSGEPIFGPEPPPGPDVLEAAAWLVDARGTPFALTLELSSERTGPSDARLTARGALPSGAAPWTLVGVSLGYPNTPGSSVVELTPVSLTAGDAIPWPSPGMLALDRTTPEFRVAFARDAAGIPDSAPGPLDALVTAALATRLGVGEGDVLTVKLDGSSRTVDVAVAAIAPALPGTADPNGVLVALPALAEWTFAAGSPLTADQVWATGAGARAGLESAFPSTRVLSGGADGGPAPALAAMWWIATIAVALLASVAIVAATAAQARRRSTEVFVLRALGLTTSMQTRAQTGELVAVVASAALAGAALGAVAAALTVPALTLSAVPGVSPVFAAALAVSPWPLVVLAVVLAAAVVVASLAVRRRIALHAEAGRVREAA